MQGAGALGTGAYSSVCEDFQESPRRRRRATQQMDGHLFTGSEKANLTRRDPHLGCSSIGDDSMRGLESSLFALRYLTALPMQVLNLAQPLSRHFLISPLSAFLQALFHNFLNSLVS
jgi:hypothetical protein